MRGRGSSTFNNLDRPIGADALPKPSASNDSRVASGQAVAERMGRDKGSDLKSDSNERFGSSSSRHHPSSSQAGPPSPASKTTTNASKNAQSGRPAATSRFGDRTPQQKTTTTKPTRSGPSPSSSSRVGPSQPTPKTTNKRDHLSPGPAPSAKKGRTASSLAVPFSVPVSAAPSAPSASSKAPKEPYYAVDKIIDENEQR